MPERYLPIVAIVIATYSFVALAMLAAKFIRNRTTLRASRLPYECGNYPIGNARVRFVSRFCQIAFLFMIFEIEIFLLAPWMTRIAAFGWSGIIKAGIFLTLMLLTLGYAVKNKDLEWE